MSKLLIISVLALFLSVVSLDAQSLLGATKEQILESNKSYDLVKSEPQPGDSYTSLVYSKPKEIRIYFLQNNICTCINARPRNFSDFRDYILTLDKNCNIVAKDEWEAYTSKGKKINISLKYLDSSGLPVFVHYFDDPILSDIKIAPASINVNTNLSKPEKKVQSQDGGF